MERWFPGLRNEMLAYGAVPVDIGEDLAWLTPAGWAPRRNSGLVMLAFGRELLDYLLVERVRSLGNLRIEDGVGVNGLVGLRADLIVDATGRGSQLPLWLRELGYEPPEVVRVSAKLGYASRYYEGVSATWKAAFIQANPPLSMRAGVLFPIQGNRWVATVAGGNGEYPPADEDGFLEFARTLPSPVIYDALRAARPISPVLTYRATDNRWRLYHRLKRHPEGLLAVGDAICAFNPVYGQGMTVAAECVLALDECLRRQPRELWRRFYAKSAKIIQGAWMLATSEDSRYPAAEGARLTTPVRWMQAYVARVIAASLDDPVVRKRWLEVFQMLRSPATLFSPPILLRVLSSHSSSPSPNATASAGCSARPYDHASSSCAESS
jgi:2-polyprenyl-6-methoxyphenol hydroxylase-like FAD-dependent oxidoreductase